MLYRAEGGGEGEGRRFGEIRYVVKGEVGRDCEQHGGERGRVGSEEGSSDGGRRGGDGKTKGKERTRTREKEKQKEKEKRGGSASSEHGSDVSKMRAEMAGLRNDIANMRLGGGMGMATGATPMMGPSPAGMPPFDPRFEFGAPQGDMLAPGGLPSPMTGADPRMGPPMGHMDPFPVDMDMDMDMRHHRSMPQRRARKPHRRPGPGRTPRLGGPGESDLDFSDPSSDPFVGMGHLADGVPPHVARPLRRGHQKQRRARHAKHMPFAQRPGAKFETQGYDPRSEKRRRGSGHAPRAHAGYGFDHSGSPPRRFGGPDVLDVLDEEDEDEDEEEEDWLRDTQPRAGM